MRAYFWNNANLKSLVGCHLEADFQTAAYTLSERPMYGSSRLGIDKTNIEFIGYSPSPTNITNHILGLKQYEGSNHLGNVLTVISDKKIPVDENADGTVDYYMPDIVISSDYAPFGGLLAERSFFSEKYPHSFNGKSDDPELGDWQDYGMRMYSPFQRRFPSTDPLIVYGQEYPWYSPYQFAGNKPIWAVDLDGLEEYRTSTGELIGKYGNSTEVRIVFDEYVEAAKNIVSHKESMSVNDVYNDVLYNKGSAGVFNNPDLAAEDWGIRYNDLSIRNNKEYSSFIFMTRINDVAVVSYTRAVIGDETSVSNSFTSKKNKTLIASIHSHAAYKEGIDVNNFSKDYFDPVSLRIVGDINGYDRLKINGYVSTPSGSLLKYNHLSKNVSIISCDMPFDKKDPESSLLNENDKPQQSVKINSSIE